MKRALVGLVPVTLLCAFPQGGPAYETNEAGLAAYARGDYAAAERFYTQALDLWHAMGPAYDAHSSTTLFNLGQALCQDGKWTPGLDAFEQGLAISRRTLGPKHRRTVMLLNSVGNAELVLGEWTRAESALDEALAIGRELYPKELETGRTLISIAGLRLRQKRPDEALPLADEALDLILATAGENSTDAAMAYSAVAQVHRAAGRTDRALPLFRKSRAIWAATAGPNSPRLASTISQEGLALMDDGKLALAEDDMRTALGILNRCTGCSYEAAVAQTNWGTLLTREGKLPQAATALTKALETEQRIAPTPETAMAATLEALAQVRTKQKRFADAAGLRARATAIQSYR